MPFSLREETDDDRVASEKAQQKKIARLEEIQQELDLYASPLWPSFRKHLDDDVDCRFR